MHAGFILQKPYYIERVYVPDIYIYIIHNTKISLEFNVTFLKLCSCYVTVCHYITEFNCFL